ncbi:MAG: phosphotransferase family protein [Proteobacteria bacterium]|nr:phosphotransferase family protein [Pseudomonadota bacterium]
MTDSIPSDAIPVRSGEDLDWPRIEARLKAEMPELEGRMSVFQFPRGHANLTYLLRFGDRELVLRRPPFGPLAPGGHDMIREYKVLSRLWRHFDRAPRAYLICEDESVAGAVFFVMERRTGVVIDGPIPDELAHHPEVERRVSMALVEAMAELHGLDPAEMGLMDLGRPHGFVQRQVSGWHKRWHLAKEGELRLFDQVHQRLERSIPEPPRVSLVHNDLGLHNCQFDPADPDRAKSFFDWDMTTVGDPLIDLGTLLNYWPEHGDDYIRNRKENPDLTQMPPRIDMIRRYSERTGVEVDRARWYEAFALWKTAVVVQQIYIRYARGQTDDERFARMNQHPPILVRLASDTLEDIGL